MIVQTTPKGDARGSRAKSGPSAMSGEFAIRHASDGSLIMTHKPSAPAHAEMAGESATAVKAKAKTVAATAVGTAIGAVAGGPLGAAVGAGLGAALDWYRHHQKAVAAAAILAKARAGASGVSPDLSVRIKPIVLKALAKAAPNLPTAQILPLTMRANAATSPSAVNPDPNTVAAKNAADALYGYFQQYPYDRMFGDVFWKASKTGILVKAFQNAYNADAVTNVVTGPLAVSGYYDAKTAGALTLYTHDPIDPDPNT